MAKLIKRLSNGYWLIKEFSFSKILKRKLYENVTKKGIKKWVVINKRKVKVF